MLKLTKRIYQSEYIKNSMSLIARNLVTRAQFCIRLKAVTITITTTHHIHDGYILRDIKIAKK